MNSNIVREIFFFLDYLEIQKLFKCIEIEASLSVQTNEENISIYNCLSSKEAILEAPSLHSISFSNSITRVLKFIFKKSLHKKRASLFLKKSKQKITISLSQLRNILPSLRSISFSNSIAWARNFIFQKFSKESLNKMIHIESKFSSGAALVLQTSKQKITISLSQLRNILLNSPCKFQKRIFNPDNHVEFILSKDKVKNTEFLPLHELHEIKAPVYPFLILHAIRLKVNKEVNYIFLRKDGVCHIFGTSDVFQKVQLCCGREITDFTRNGNIKSKLSHVAREHNSIQNKNIKSMFFCVNILKKEQYLHLFFQENEYLLTFYWGIKDNSLQINFPAYAEKAIYSENLLLNPTSDFLGFYIFDVKSGNLYHESHSFSDDGNFVEDYKTYTNQWFNAYWNLFLFHALKFHFL